MILKVKIEKETEKAIRVDGFWLPKSQIEIINDGSIEVPEWLLKSKGMDTYTETYTMDNKVYERIFLYGKFDQAIYFVDDQVMAVFNEQEDSEQTLPDTAIKTTSGFKL